MTAAGYVLGLLSILSGLAIADLMVSLNRLIRAGSRVRWDWLPLVGAALAGCSVVVAWWFGWQNALDPTYTPAFGGFLMRLGQLLLLFLMACAALPDEIPAGGVDLKAYYDANGRYFWGLYAALTLVFLVKDVIILKGGGGELWGLAVGVAWAGSTLVAALVLAFVRRRIVHAILAPLLLAGSILPNLYWSLSPAPA